MIITLTSDFGPGRYVAAMKGVILSINPQAVVVDLDHGVKPQDVREGAFVLYTTLPSFPQAIHVAVVDPGVGTSRRPLVVETDRGALVGPDNGLLIPAAKLLGLRRVSEISNRKYMRPAISKTFHGRDIFAPVAAHLSLGVPVPEIGQEVADYHELDFGVPQTGPQGLSGSVIHVDRFGNLITNIPGESLERWDSYGGSLEVDVGGRNVRATLARTYGEVPRGSFLVIVGSSDLVEVSVNGGSAAESLGARAGFSLALRKA
jgi:S-adenosylmethionine hydrolase